MNLVIKGIFTYFLVARGDASSLDKGVHLISKGCTLAKFSQFFREIGSFLPFSGNLWGARAPSAPPLTAPLLVAPLGIGVSNSNGGKNEVDALHPTFDLYDLPNMNTLKFDTTVLIIEMVWISMIKVLSTLCLCTLVIPINCLKIV